MSQTEDQNLLNDQRARDQSHQVPGMPPNFGRSVIPHIVTFPDMLFNVARSYRNPDEAIRDSRQNPIHMRQDVWLTTFLKARQRMISQTNWKIVPEDEHCPKQKKLAERITNIIRRMRPGFQRYRQWLQEAIWFGRCAVNNVYGWQWINGERTLGIDHWWPVHGDKLVWKYDDHTFPGSGPVGIRIGYQSTPELLGNSSLYKGAIGLIGGRNRRVEVTNDYGLAYFLEDWERRLLTIHTHEIEDAAYEDSHGAGAIHGIGIRSQIYWFWILKQEALQQLVEFVERVGQGFTIYYYDSGNPDARSEMETIAKEHTGSNVVLFPRPLGDDNSTYGIERIEPGAGAIDSLRSLVEDFFGDAILRFILGQTLTMKAEATGIGAGATDAHEKSLHDIVVYDAKNHDESLTHELVQPLKEFNEPAARNVHLRFESEVEDPHVEKQMDALKQAYDMGMKVPVRRVAQLVGIGEATSEEEFLSLEQQQQQMGGMMPGMGGGDSFGGIPGMEGGNGMPDVDKNHQFALDQYRKTGRILPSIRQRYPHLSRREVREVLDYLSAA